MQTAPPPSLVAPFGSPSVFSPLFHPTLSHPCEIRHPFLPFRLYFCLLLPVNQLALATILPAYLLCNCRADGNTHVWGCIAPAPPLFDSFCHGVTALQKPVHAML